MDVVYVVPSDFAEMTLTSGQFLEVELRRLNVEKTELAVRLKVRYATVLDWCRGRGGFNGPSAHNQKNRVAAARALGLDDNHFEIPEATYLHREKCRKALAAFLANPLAPKDITEVELANLRATFPPLDREPTELFYEGYFYLLRNRLSPSRLAAELEENEALQRSVEQKLGKAYAVVQAEEEARAKNAQRRAQKRAAKKREPHR
jgi:hypothetical protein